MRVVTLKDIPMLPVEGAAEQTAGWTGPVSRSRQTIIPPGDSAHYNCSVVHLSLSRLWYAVPPTKGGTTDGPYTVHRCAGAPLRIPGFDQLDAR